jgi:glycerol-3-phosphate acyltransferase PlsY
MTTIGGLLALSPLVALTSLLSGAIPLIVSRFASLGSITLALLAPVLLLSGALLGYLPIEYVLYGCLVCIMTLYELRPNIQRLLAGCERKIGEKAAT